MRLGCLLLCWLGGFEMTKDEESKVADIIKDMAEHIESLQSENEELRAWIKAATTEITKAIGGGSEMFTPHGDEFRVDPAFVASFIQYRRQRHAESKKASIQKERELLARADTAEAEVERLRQFLFPYADATEISGISWDGKYLIGDKESIRAFHEMKNRGEQIDVYRRAYDQKEAALKARAEAAEAEVKRYRVALIAAKTRMRNCRGAIESNQVVDKDVHGSLQNGIRDIQDALASTGGEHHAE